MLATQGQHLSHSRRKLLSVHLFTQPFHKELPCTSCNQHVQDAKSSTVHETVPTLFFLKGSLSYYHAIVDGSGLKVLSLDME